MFWSSNSQINTSNLCIPNTNLKRNLNSCPYSVCTISIRISITIFYVYSTNWKYCDNLFLCFLLVAAFNISGIFFNFFYFCLFEWGPSLTMTILFSTTNKLRKFDVDAWLWCVIVMHRWSKSGSLLLLGNTCSNASRRLTILIRNGDDGLYTCLPDLHSLLCFCLLLLLFLL